MRLPFSLVLLCSILLAGCGSSGISKESSRTPKGNPNAVVTVQEFSDIQCPACRTVHLQLVPALLQEYGERIRFEFLHFPLQSIHPMALRAAMASECAADQGKFWEYIDLAYVQQSALSADVLSLWAGELGMDTALFDRCLRSEVKRDVVMQDYSEARKLNLRGTPTFLVNGKEVPTNGLPQAIEAAEASILQRL